MFSFKPSLSETHPVSGSTRIILGTVETSKWIRNFADELGLDRIERDGFVIKTLKEGTDVAIIVAGKIPAGVIFGVFDLNSSYPTRTRSAHT